jgi:UDP-2,3-diacylglucosamine pyrophosphatase LpxH
MSQPGIRRVFIISDLHVGGAYAPTPEGRGFRMNTHIAELAKFVNGLAESPTAAPAELIINGDMVDFLAERDNPKAEWVPFTADPAAACARLRAIVNRDSIFFEALHAFLEKGNRLVILTGNHDVELALPAVRQVLREVIGVRPGHDYELIANGEAYSIGNALIEHGNRYDQWNMVNYDALRHTASLQSRRLPEDGYAFDPPPGSKMVSWVINPIKEDYKFVDLLKPETAVLVPLLLALEPGYRKILATVAILARQAGKQALASAAMPSLAGDISSQGQTTGRVSDMSTFSFDSPVSSPAQAEGEDALRQLLDANLNGQGAAFLDRLPSAGAAVTAGDISSFGDAVNRSLGMAKLLLSHDDADVGRRLPALLEALRAVHEDKSFDLDHETAPVYVEAAKTLFRGGFRYVIFGHTHMAKQMELQPGCWYLNSGTWADLMQMPQGILNGASDAEAIQKLQAFLLGICTGPLTQWLLYRPTYVQLEVDANRNVVNAQLCTYTVPAPAAS